MATSADNGCISTDRQGIGGRRWLPDAGAIGLLVALCVLFYWSVLTPVTEDRSSFPKGDFNEQFYSYAFFRANELLQGRVPLWNPYVFSGSPFVADIQSAVFYPLGWLTTLLAGRSFPLSAFQAEAVFHVLLASVFTYLFLRRATSSRFGGLVGAIVFSYGGYLTSYPILQLAILEVQVWFPLILLFVHLATGQEISSKARWAYTIVAGLALGTSILAGHPQSSLFVLYGTTAYFAYRLFCLWKDNGRADFLRAAPPILAFLGLGVGLAAVQLLPASEFTALTARANVSYEYASRGFPVRDIIQLLLPGSVSLWSPLYVGILPLILAFLAGTYRPSRDVAFWGGVAGLSLLLSFGGGTFLYRLFYLVAPGFAMFRGQERLAFLFSFSVAVLAAYGAGGMRTRWPAWLSRCLLWAVVAAAAALVALFVVSEASGKVGNIVNTTAFLVLLLAMAALLAYLREKGVPALVLYGLALAMIVLDLFTVNWQANVEKADADQRYSPTPIVRYLQEHANEGRVSSEFYLPLNYGDVYGIEDIRGSSPLVLRRYADLLAVQPRERMWQLLNVKYFVTWDGNSPSGEKVMQEKFSDKDAFLYRVPDPLPRAYVVYKASVVADDKKAIEMLGTASFDPSRTVLLAEDPGVALLSDGQTPPGADGPPKVVVEEKRPDTVRVRAELDRAGILVLSEVDYPGWLAQVDGHPQRILRANYALRAIALGPGSHEVVFTYGPRAVYLGGAVSGVALLGGLVALVAIAAMGRRRRPVSQAD